MHKFAAAVTKVFARDSLEFLLLILIPSAESADSRGKGSLISILCLSSLILLVASYLLVMVTSWSVFNCTKSTISCKFSCALPSDAMTSACSDTAIMSSSCFARSSPDRNSWLYRPRARCSSRNWRITMAPPSSKEVCSISCTTAFVRQFLARRTLVRAVGASAHASSLCAFCIALSTQHHRGRRRRVRPQ